MTFGNKTLHKDRVECSAEVLNSVIHRNARKVNILTDEKKCLPYSLKN